MRIELGFRIVCASSLLAALVYSSAADTPVTPNSSSEAQALFAFLQDTSGKKTLSGQQAGWPAANELPSELAYIREASGKLPALLAMDLAPYTKPGSVHGHDVVGRAIDWYRKRNGVVSLCWHWAAPLNERVFYTKDTSFRPGRAVIEGTPDYEAALRDIDLIAAELKVLQDAHVPVLWRPLHEANGRWFWWGADGPETFKKLWRMIYDRLTVYHKLNNLIWVFSPGAGIDVCEWYPGDSFVDIIAPDHYPMDGNDDPAEPIFEQMAALGGGTKLIAFGENGPIPAPDKMRSEKVHWLFFVTWSGKVLTGQNPADKVRAAYNDPDVLTLADLPNLRSYGFHPAGKPVKLVFAPTGDLAVGSPALRPFVVAVQDAKGQTVRTGRHKVSISLRTGSPGALLNGASTVETVNGLAVFTDLAINAPGRFTLRAESKSLAPAESRSFLVGPGHGILSEWWDSKAGGGNSFAAAGAPSGCRVLGRGFTTPYAMATNVTARFSGYLVPPLTGEYVFWIASDAASQLWIGSNAISKARIAEISSATPYCKWPHTHEAQSAPVHLTAGKRYYVEALQRQKGGSIHFWARWRLPDGSEECPIPGARLMLPSESGNSKLLTDAQP